MLALDTEADATGDQHIDLRSVREDRRDQSPGDQAIADLLVGAAVRAPAAATAKPAQRRYLSAIERDPTVPRAQVVAIALDAIARTGATRGTRSGGAC